MNRIARITLFLIGFALITNKSFSQTYVNSPKVIRTKAGFFMFGQAAESIYHSIDLREPLQKISFEDLRENVTAGSNKDGSRIVVTGASRVMYYYEIHAYDAAESSLRWQQSQLNIDSEYNIIAVQYIGGDDLIASTDQGFLISNDFGQSWISVQLYFYDPYNGISLFRPHCLIGFPDQIFLTSTSGGYCNDFNLPVLVSNTSLEALPVSGYRSEIYFDPILKSTLSVKGHYESTGSGKYQFILSEIRSGKVLKEFFIDENPSKILAGYPGGIVYTTLKSDEDFTNVRSILNFFDYSQVVHSMESPLKYPTQAYVFDKDIWVVADNRQIAVSTDHGKNWTKL